MKKVSLPLLALATALAISPAARADTVDFSFTTAAGIPSYSGSGTFDVNTTTGVITNFTGTFYSGATDEGAMTLLTPGAFASNDNVFQEATGLLSENGLSFSVVEGDLGVVNYNIYYFATSENYVATGCSVGDQTCITANAYGVPSYPLIFVTAPEPYPFLLFGTGLLGLAIILFRKEKASGLTSNS